MPEKVDLHGRMATYVVTAEVSGSYRARTAGGNRILLIPITDARPPLDRVTGDILLSFRQSVRFELAGEGFESSAAIVECANEALENTFDVLADDLARSLRADQQRPPPQRVSQELSRWEALLRSKRHLSREEEVGLWGELWFLSSLPNADEALSIWRGPEAENVDFVGGGIGVECKASMRRLEHYVSQEQVTRPLGELAVFVLSLWVDRDPTGGRTINDLIAAVEERLADRTEFESKLLGTGYSRADSHHYKLRLRELEHPLLFPIDAVPRVRDADPGVTNIRFLAALEEASALDPQQALRTIARLSGT